jgi:CheY-like chemotaxis protein
MMEILINKTILIVDDEADLREPLVTEFESLGCKVFQAKNGREAFEIVRKEKIDAVISDIRMPGGDGIEFLKRVKDYNYQCPVVMLITGFSDLTQDEAFNLGAEAVLSKPFDLDAIEAALVRILTPREERWKKLSASQKTKHTIEKNFADFEKALETKEIAFGRGGFFIKNEFIQPRAELVGFDIQFDRGDILRIEGNGYVRWARVAKDELPAGCGIEFESLSDEVKDTLIAIIDRKELVPFIPKK